MKCQKTSSINWMTFGTYAASHLSLQAVTEIHPIVLRREKQRQVEKQEPMPKGSRQTYESIMEMKISLIGLNLQKDILIGWKTFLKIEYERIRNTQGTGVPEKAPAAAAWRQKDAHGGAGKGGQRIRIYVICTYDVHSCGYRLDAVTRNPLQILHGDGCVTGGRPGLQNRGAVVISMV